MNDETIKPEKLKPRHRYKIHDNLYDLTDFVKIHPGGQDMFNNLKPDTNITPMIYSYHKNPKKILAMLPKYEIPFTDEKNDFIKIEYDTNYTYDNYCELKKLVYDEIHEKKIPLYWTNTEILYHMFMLSMYLGMWGYCFYYAENLSYWWMILLGVFTTGWGILVFHELSHYIGFKNQNINNILSYITPFFNEKLWKYEHNYLHHSFTDSDYDYDLLTDNSYYVRYTNTPLHFHHKFQFIYMFLIFMLGSLLFKPHIHNSIYKSNKLFVLIIFYYFGLNKLMLFYMVFNFHFITIAQLSHIHHECIQINTENKNDFLYNQVSSSINYKTDNIITRFICLGLDIQIEHHLFPNIPHSSLRKIQHIVREYCDKNNIPYIEKQSVFSAFYSYITYIYNMGNPKSNLIK